MATQLPPPNIFLSGSLTTGHSVVAVNANTVEDSGSSGGGGATYAATVSALNAASLSGISSVVLGGYNATNDGGGGTLIYQSGGTVDNVVWFEDSESNTFKRQSTEFLSAKQAGAVGDGTTDDTTAFNRLDTAGGGFVMPDASGGTTYYINGSWSPTHRVTIGSGAVIKLGASAVVTFSDLVILDDFAQCFDIVSGASLTIKKVDHLTPYHFGAVGDGTTDDSIAVNQAIIYTPSYGTVAFPGGSFAISTTTGINQSAVGVTYLGYGSQLVKTGSGNNWFFHANTNNRFLGLTINANETPTFWGQEAAGSSGIRVNASDQISGVEIAHCNFENLLIGLWIDGCQNWNIHDNMGTNFFHALNGACSPTYPITNLRIAGNNFQTAVDAVMSITSISGTNASPSAMYMQILDNIIINGNTGSTHANDGFALDLESSSYSTDSVIAGNIVQQLSTGSNGAYRGGISISGTAVNTTARIIVRNNVVIGDSSTSTAGGYSCIHMEFSTNCTVSDNEMYNYAGNGVCMFGSQDCVVENNQIVNCGSTGEAAIFMCNSGSGNTLVNAKVINNKLTVLSGYANAATTIGIECDCNTAGSSGIEISGNTIENFQTYGIVAAGASGTNLSIDRICDNQISGGGASANGIYVGYLVGTMIKGNRLRDIGVSLAGADLTDTIVANNSFYDDSSATSYFVEVTGTNTNCWLIDNNFLETGSGTGYVTFSGATIYGNKGIGGSGYVTENSGTATIPTSADFITVAHGLAATPTNIQVTPQSSITPNDQFWVASVTSTDFNIVLPGDPTSAVTFYWRAVVATGV